MQEICSVTFPKMARASLNIVILGSGISGLSAALGLLQKGHHVTLTDPAVAFANGIVVQPNASRVLDHYGICKMLPLLFPFHSCSHVLDMQNNFGLIRYLKSSANIAPPRRSRGRRMSSTIAVLTMPRFCAIESVGIM